MMTIYQNQQTATIRLTQQPPQPAPANATTPAVAAAAAVVAKGAARVRLVGSVHIAEPGYYQALEASVDGWCVGLLAWIVGVRPVSDDGGRHYPYVWTDP